MDTTDVAFRVLALVGFSGLAYMTYKVFFAGDKPVENNPQKLQIKEILNDFKAVKYWYKGSDYTILLHDLGNIETKLLANGVTARREHDKLWLSAEGESEVFEFVPPQNPMREQ
jgi:hypothetical protein